MAVICAQLTHTKTLETLKSVRLVVKHYPTVKLVLTISPPVPAAKLAIISQLLLLVNHALVRYQIVMLVLLHQEEDLSSARLVLMDFLFQLIRGHACY